MTYHRKTKAEREMASRRPSRKAVMAAINAQRPLDMPAKDAKRKPVRKLTRDDLPEF